MITKNFTDSLLTLDEERYIDRKKFSLSKAVNVRAF